jgi:hypothetical protein
MNTESFMVLFRPQIQFHVLTFDWIYYIHLNTNDRGPSRMREWRQWLINRKEGTTLHSSLSDGRLSYRVVCLALTGRRDVEVIPTTATGSETIPLTYHDVCSDRRDAKIESTSCIDSTRTGIQSGRGCRTATWADPGFGPPVV